MSIQLPVFIVHGNHDDPTVDVKNEARVASAVGVRPSCRLICPAPQALSALHILSASNLLNYFGAYSNVRAGAAVRPRASVSAAHARSQMKSVFVRPIIMQKGQTKVRRQP